MKLLAIDTSTDKATVALAVNGRVFEEEHTVLRQHAQALLPMIERLLSASGLVISQLDGLVFGRGPGSFTGLRIACSVAKGLAHAHDRPLYPVSSLAAIAFKTRQHTELADSNVLAVIDARMHQLYWALFTSDSYQSIEQVTDASEISEYGHKPIVMAGIGFEPYFVQLQAKLKKQIIEQRVIYPDAATMINLVQSGHIKPISAAEALPIYIRNQVTHGEPRG